MMYESRVYVIDDNAAFRELALMVMKAASLPAFAYASAEAFLEDFDPKQLSCLVVDLKMPGMGGIELLRYLASMDCRIPIIVISGHADVRLSVQSMKLGAIDVLEKPFVPAMLVSMVRRALKSGIESFELCTSGQAVRKRFAALTPREMELLKHVIAGESNMQMADHLFISVKTVAKHRAKLMLKTQALNAADLTRLSGLAGIMPAA